MIALQCVFYVFTQKSAATGTVQLASDEVKQSTSDTVKQNSKMTTANKANAGFDRLFAGAINKQKTEPSSNNKTVTNKQQNKDDGAANHSNDDTRSPANHNESAKNTSKPPSSSHPSAKPKGQPEKLASSVSFHFEVNVDLVIELNVVSLEVLATDVAKTLGKLVNKS